MDISGRPGPGPGMESATDGASLVFTWGRPRSVPSHPRAKTNNIIGDSN
jgi:hypothetical protein